MLTFRERVHLLAASREEAMTDALTGLGNRRRFMLELDAALADESAPFALVVFDLDGFKAYNDSFGHSAGDALLARVAGRLDAAVDGEGRAYRLGGDEFCVLAGVENGESNDLCRTRCGSADRGRRRLRRQLLVRRGADAVGGGPAQ